MKDNHKDFKLPKKCERCKKEGSKESHSCPYAEDIHDEWRKDYCNCCADCEHECMQEI